MRFLFRNFSILIRIISLGILKFLNFYLQYHNLELYLFLILFDINEVICSLRTREFCGTIEILNLLDHLYSTKKYFESSEDGSHRAIMSQGRSPNSLS